MDNVLLGWSNRTTDLMRAFLVVHFMLQGEFDKIPTEQPDLKDIMEEIFALLTSLLRSMELSRKTLVDRRFGALENEHNSLINADDLKSMERADKLQRALASIKFKGYAKGKGKGYRYGWQAKGRPGGKGKGWGKGGRGFPPPTNKFSFLTALQKPHNGPQQAEARP